MDHREIPEALRNRMTEVARQLRKTATPSEDILWKALRGRKLEGRKFRRQQQLGPFVVDFFCAQERLVLEVDGGVHNSQSNLDSERQRLIESLGLRFLRVSAREVEEDLEESLRKVRESFRVEHHPQPPGPPSPIQGEGGEVAQASPPAFPEVLSPLVGEGI